jgi:hypothetical protein
MNVIISYSSVEVLCIFMIVSKYTNNIVKLLLNNKIIDSTPLLKLNLVKCNEATCKGCIIYHDILDYVSNNCYLKGNIIESLLLRNNIVDILSIFRGNSMIKAICIDVYLTSEQLAHILHLSTIFTNTFVNRTRIPSNSILIWNGVNNTLIVCRGYAAHTKHIKLVFNIINYINVLTLGGTIYYKGKYIDNDNLVANDINIVKKLAIKLNE